MKAISTITHKENSGFLKRNGRRCVVTAVVLTLLGGGKSLCFNDLRS